MATEYHSENSASFAAGSWSGSGIAASNDYVVETGSVPVVNDLDHTGLTGGIESFTIGTDRTGDIGAAGNPFRVDVDNSADAYILNRAKAGRFYYKAEGDSNVCNNFSHFGGGRSYLEGGTVTNLYVGSGYVEANEATVITNCDLFGSASASFEYNATGFTTLDIFGTRRTITLRREATLTINAPVTVVLDIDNETTPTFSVTMNHPGAMLYVVRCDTLATANIYAGTVDLRPAQRAVAFGSSAHNRGPYTNVLTDSRHTITAPVWVGNLQDIGGAMPGGL